MQRININKYVDSLPPPLNNHGNDITCQNTTSPKTRYTNTVIHSCTYRNLTIIAAGNLTINLSAAFSIDTLSMMSFLC